MSFQTTHKYPGFGVKATIGAQSQIPQVSGMSTFEPYNSLVLRSTESDSGIGNRKMLILSISDTRAVKPSHGFTAPHPQPVPGIREAPDRAGGMST